MWQDVCLKILFRRQAKLRAGKTLGERRLRSPLQGLLRLRTPENVFPSRILPCLRYIIGHTSLPLLKNEIWLALINVMCTKFLYFHIQENLFLIIYNLLLLFHTCHNLLYNLKVIHQQEFCYHIHCLFHSYIQLDLFSYIS